MSTVLECHYADYNPTQDEIVDYARWLGAELPEDNDLLHIAVEGLKAPLEGAWRAVKSQAGELYYFNFATQESSWSHPQDRVFLEKFKTAKAEKVGREAARQQQQQPQQQAGGEGGLDEDVSAAELRLRRKATGRSLTPESSSVGAGHNNSSSNNTNSNPQQIADHLTRSPSRHAQFGVSTPGTRSRSPSQQQQQQQQRHETAYVPQGIASLAAQIDQLGSSESLDSAHDGDGAGELEYDDVDGNDDSERKPVVADGGLTRSSTMPYVSSSAASGRTAPAPGSNGSSPAGSSATSSTSARTATAAAAQAKPKAGGALAAATAARSGKGSKSKHPLAQLRPETAATTSSTGLPSTASPSPQKNIAQIQQQQQAQQQQKAPAAAAAAAGTTAAPEQQQQHPEATRVSPAKKRIAAAAAASSSAAATATAAAVVVAASDDGGNRSSATGGVISPSRIKKGGGESPQRRKQTEAQQPQQQQPQKQPAPLGGLAPVLQRHLPQSAHDIVLEASGHSSSGGGSMSNSSAATVAATALFNAQPLAKRSQPQHAAPSLSPTDRPLGPVTVKQPLRTESPATASHHLTNGNNHLQQQQQQQQPDTPALFTLDPLQRGGPAAAEAGEAHNTNNKKLASVLENNDRTASASSSATSRSSSSSISPANVPIASSSNNGSKAAIAKSTQQQQQQQQPMPAAANTNSSAASSSATTPAAAAAASTASAPVANKKNDDAKATMQNHYTNQMIQYQQELKTKHDAAVAFARQEAAEKIKRDRAHIETETAQQLRSEVEKRTAELKAAADANIQEATKAQLARVREHVAKAKEDADKQIKLIEDAQKKRVELMSKNVAAEANAKIAQATAKTKMMAEQQLQELEEKHKKDVAAAAAAASASTSAATSAAASPDPKNPTTAATAADVAIKLSDAAAKQQYALVQRAYNEFASTVSSCDEKMRSLVNQFLSQLPARTDDSITKLKAALLQQKEKAETEAVESSKAAAAAAAVQQQKQTAALQGELEKKRGELKAADEQLAKRYLDISAAVAQLERLQDEIATKKLAFEQQSMQRRRDQTGEDESDGTTKVATKKQTSTFDTIPGAKASSSSISSSFVAEVNRLRSSPSKVTYVSSKKQQQQQQPDQEENVVDSEEERDESSPDAAAPPLKSTVAAAVPATNSTSMVVKSNTASAEMTSASNVGSISLPELRSVITDVFNDLVASGKIVSASTVQLAETIIAANAAASRKQQDQHQQQQHQQQHNLKHRDHQFIAAAPPLLTASASAVPPTPMSYASQRRMIAQERSQLAAARAFLSQQQAELERRGASVRVARSTWKSDVRECKAAGVSAHSRKAGILRSVKVALDEQATTLQHDAELLQSTAAWLNQKEMRLSQSEAELLREHNAKSAVRPTSSSSAGAAAVAITDIASNDDDNSQGFALPRPPPLFAARPGDQLHNKHFVEHDLNPAAAAAAAASNHHHQHQLQYGAVDNSMTSVATTSIFESWVQSGAAPAVRASAAAGGDDDESASAAAAAAAAAKVERPLFVTSKSQVQQQRQQQKQQPLFYPSQEQHRLARLEAQMGKMMEMAAVAAASNQNVDNGNNPMFRRPATAQLLSSSSNAKLAMMEADAAIQMRSRSKPSRSRQQQQQQQHQQRGRSAAGTARSFATAYPTSGFSAGGFLTNLRPSAF